MGDKCNICGAKEEKNTISTIVYLNSYGIQRTVTIEKSNGLTFWKRY